MEIQENVPLSKYSTMRLGGNAAYLTQIHNRNDLQEAVKWAKDKGLKMIMIGIGSNIIWSDDGFRGLVLVNRLMGYQSFAEDPQNFYITIGAGENWDSVVKRAAESGLTGIECLSLIPGTTGGTPIQNVGAYGQDISQTLVSVEAYDTLSGKFVNIANTDCVFGYRTSRFKTVDKGRFLITTITLHLMIGNPTPPFYPALQHYLNEHLISNITPQTVRDAIINIRNSKLPDPLQVANCGSFFANPIVDQGILSQLLADFPDVIYWPAGINKIKISAAWLVEKAGFKGMHDGETGMSIWGKHSLVIVNEHATKTADLLKFKQKIISAVHQMTGVTLEQEPEILP